MGADGGRAAPAAPLSVLPMVLSPEEWDNAKQWVTTCIYLQSYTKNMLFCSCVTYSDWKKSTVAKSAHFFLLIGQPWICLWKSNNTFSCFFPSEAVTSAVNIFNADFHGYERGTFFLSFFSIFIGIDLSCLSHQPFLWHWSLANRTKLWQAGRKTVSFPAFRMNDEYRKIQPRLTSFFVKVWLFFSAILPEDARSPTSWWSWGGSGFAQSVCLKPWSLESHGSWKFVCRGECEHETTIRLEWREHLQRILAARLFFLGGRPGASAEAPMSGRRQDRELTTSARW